jgi:monolysocardiolipin acyltransferase
MGSVGALSRGFLYGLNNVEVTGLNNLLRVLDRRKDVENRQRGLLTVCNHVAVYV